MSTLAKKKASSSKTSSRKVVSSSKKISRVNSKIKPRPVSSNSASKSNKKNKSLALTNSGLSSIGDLPELPDFEDFSKAMDATSKDKDLSDDVAAPAQIVDQSNSESTNNSIDGKPKLWWLSWLLPGKKQPVIDAQSTDVSPQNVADNSMPSLSDMPTHEELTVSLPDNSSKDVVSNSSTKKEKKKQAKQEAHIARAYEEVDALKTKMDDEFRERQSLVTEHHEQVKIKEAELEKWHTDLLNRENDVVKKEKEYERIKKLEVQLEDKEITLKYKEDEIEDLKNQLAHKELELTQQEGSLKELSKKLEKMQEQKQKILATEHIVSDDYHKLAKRHNISVSSKTEPRNVLSKTVSTVNSATKRDVRNLLLKAYDQLAAGDMASLKVTYGKIRDSYSRMLTTTGQDEQLYKDIMDLYSDIKLAVVQRS